MNRSTLVHNLASAGMITPSLSLGEGTEVLLLLHGGRVLGIFPSLDADNAYWTHPALDHPESVLAFFASGAWENSGDDRTWLAPELDLFFANCPDISMAAYFQPRGVATGAYKISSTETGLWMSCRMRLDLFHSKAKLEVELTKSLEPVRNPLRHAPERAGLGRISFSGYEQHTVLEILCGDRDRIGLWGLLQLTHGGEMMIPTFSPGEPRVYFGTIPREDLRVADRVVLWTMRVSGEQKIGLRAAQCCGGSDISTIPPKSRGSLFAISSSTLPASTSTHRGTSLRIWATQSRHAMSTADCAASVRPNITPLRSARALAADESKMLVRCGSSGALDLRLRRLPIAGSELSAEAHHSMRSKRSAYWHLDRRGDAGDEPALHCVAAQDLRFLFR
jgi:hypothetical protein